MFNFLLKKDILLQRFSGIPWLFLVEIPSLAICSHLIESHNSQCLENVLTWKADCFILIWACFALSKYLYVVFVLEEIFQTQFRTTRILELFLWQLPKTMRFLFNTQCSLTECLLLYLTSFTSKENFDEIVFCYEPNLPW